MTMTNLDTDATVDISVPIVLDRDTSPDHSIVAISPSGLELVCECAMADGALYPVTHAEPTRRTFLNCARDATVAWLAMSPSAEVILAHKDDMEVMSYLNKGSARAGQIHPDWRSLMPERNRRESPASVARICELANVDDPERRHQMIWDWIEEGVYANQDMIS